jgi:hypothetical protein
MKIISTINGIGFAVSTKFKSQYITLNIENLLFKAENELDDYNEVYSCCKCL